MCSDHYILICISKDSPKIKINLEYWSSRAIKWGSSHCNENRAAVFGAIDDSEWAGITE